MKDEQLINKKFHILQRNKIIQDSEKFIYNEIGNRITDNLEGINLSISKCLEIGRSSNKIYEYIIKKSKNIEYSILDISKKLLVSLPPSIKTHCIDHDNWNINKNKYDLIVSNYYLHLTNNFNKLLLNINFSLKKQGFFIASIPSHNCFLELKNAMLLVDTEIYGGAYKRFQDNISIQTISNLLKVNNFKDTLIEIDTLKLEYDDFSKMLNDVKNLGNSYIFSDRKNKFEYKKYFKKLEETYCNKNSDNNKINLTLEIIYFSGWKE